MISIPGKILLDKLLFQEKERGVGFSTEKAPMGKSHDQEAHIRRKEKKLARCVSPGKKRCSKKVASTPAGRRRKGEKSDGSVLHDSGRKESRKREKMMRHTLSVGEESIFSPVHFLVV